MRFSDGLDVEPEVPKEPAPPKIPPPPGKILTEKVKSLVFWAGLISSIISAVAYIIIVFVMVFGFRVETTLTNNIVFSLITAFVGLLISQFLKWQGISFAKKEEDVAEVWERYYKRKTKKRKYRSLKSFWIKSFLTDMFFKSLMIALISVGTVYVFISASGDVMRILMALFNLTLFAGFGMMSLSKAYDFTKEEHVAYMLRQMEIESEKDANDN